MVGWFSFVPDGVTVGLLFFRESAFGRQVNSWLVLTSPFQGRKDQHKSDEYFPLLKGEVAAVAVGGVLHRLNPLLFFYLCAHAARALTH